MNKKQYLKLQRAGLFNYLYELFENLNETFYDGDLVLDDLILFYDDEIWDIGNSYSDIKTIGFFIVVLGAIGIRFKWMDDFFDILKIYAHELAHLIICYDNPRASYTHNYGFRKLQYKVMEFLLCLHYQNNNDLTLKITRK